MSGAQRRGPEIDGGWQTSSGPAVPPGTSESIRRDWNIVCLHLRLYCVLSTKSKKGSLHWFVLTEGRRGKQRNEEKSKAQEDK